MVINLPGSYFDGSIAYPGPPAARPITIAQGADVSLVVTVTNSAGTVVNITGWQVWLGIKNLGTDAAPLLTSQGTLTTPASGVATIPLTNAQTSTLVPGAYVYDVWGITGSGAHERLVPLSVLTIDPQAY